VTTATCIPPRNSSLSRIGSIAIERTAEAVLLNGMRSTPLFTWTLDAGIDREKAFALFTTSDIHTS